MATKHFGYDNAVKASKVIPGKVKKCKIILQEIKIFARLAIFYMSTNNILQLAIFCLEKKTIAIYLCIT